MKNELHDNLVEKDVDGNERAKKIFRYVSDVARRLDDKMKTCASIDDIFEPSFEFQRHKLRENCERLMFLDPLNYGKKSLDLLWRKVYYETISKAKKLIENSKNDFALLTFMTSGVGNFHNLITKMKFEFNLNVPLVDFTPNVVDDELCQSSKQVTEDLKQFGYAILFSCLVYIGDLNRYQAELFKFCHSYISARYYHLAILVDTSSGMPYNQLGNLYLEKNFNLDSVCYYIHCLSCPVPFEGALENLTKIFDKVSQQSFSYDDLTTCSQVEHIEQMIVTFLSLIEIWYFEKNDDTIAQKCNYVAQALKIAINFNNIKMSDLKNNQNVLTQLDDIENLSPFCMDPNHIHKIVLICLFTVVKIGEAGEQKAFSCKAFTLALMSILLQKLLNQLEELGLSCPNRKHDQIHTPKIQDSILGDDNRHFNKTEKQENSQQSSSSDPEPEATNDEVEKKLNGDFKTKRNATKRIRRRRVLSSESSDLTDSESDSSKSEDDSLGSKLNGTDCSDEEESECEVSEEDEIVLDSNKLNGKISNNELKGKAEAKIENKLNNEKLDAKDCVDDSRIQNFLLGDNFMPSLKLLQDWSLQEKKLLISCGDSGITLFQSIVDLLNIFNHYFYPDDVLENERYILKYARGLIKNLQHDYKNIPLPEDLNLRGTNICKFDKDAAEWQTSQKFKISVYEENIIRIMIFMDFGTQIARIVPQIKFNRSQKIFYLKKTSPAKFNTKVNSKKSNEWHNSKKQTETGESGLLRRLGRLWLASRVRELERTGPTAPTLIVVDAASLHKHLRQLKHLVKTKNFLILIPTVVLQELDELKSESAVRDAIRWLELQLKNGSRFLKAQKPDQSKPFTYLKLPKKMPPKIYKFMKILEFCNNFVTDKQDGGCQTDITDSKRKSLPSLILLLGNQLDSEDFKFDDFNSIAIAQSIGISVQYIGDFYTKLRQTFHKSNKKR